MGKVNTGLPSGQVVDLSRSDNVASSAWSPTA